MAEGKKNYCLLSGNLYLSIPKILIDEKINNQQIYFRGFGDILPFAKSPKVYCYYSWDYSEFFQHGSWPDQQWSKEWNSLY